MGFLEMVKSVDWEQESYSQRSADD
uniref:LAG1-like protein 3 n=1 Tax=Orobanche cernua var. cumana TaxID=78542 RepID=C6KE72_OROCE|nr:LAG1-like protein 3 [Orobanche cernua var. cumana]